LVHHIIERIGENKSRGKKDLEEKNEVGENV
jgi:hypothetical protein